MTETPSEQPEAIVAAGSPRGWRRMVKSFATLLVGEGAARLLGFVAVAILARRLGPGGFGLVTLGLSLVGWFALVVDSGTETLSIREISRNPSRFREISDRVLGLRIAISIVAAAVFVLGAYVLSRSAHDRDVLIRFGVVLPAVALNLRWMVLGIGQAKAVAAGNVASRLVFMAGVVALVSADDDVIYVPFLEAAAELAYALVILWLVARGASLPVPRIDLDYWKSTLRQSVPLMLYGVSRATVLAFDLFVIAVALGPEQVGYYGAALKPVYAVLGVLGLFSVAFLSSYSATDRAHAVELFRRTTRTALAVCLPAAVVLSAAAGVIVPLLYGAKFDPAIGLMAVIAWSIPLSALGVPYTGALIAEDQQMTLMRNSLLGVGFNVAGVLVGVLIFGVYGAAAIRVATGVVVLLLNYRSSVARSRAPSFSMVLGRAS